MLPLDLRVAFAMPPEAALAYFRSKGYAIGWDWRDVWQQAQARAFTVAGVMKADALQEIRGSLDQALEKGETFSQWQDNLIPELERLGLWGKHQLVNELTGEVKTLSPRRMDTIFRTNVQAAYMAGRYQRQLENAADRPYWQYVAIMDGRTRTSHAALHGKVFRYDDPVWRTIYPPNGFRCRCRVRSLSAADLQREGLSVEASAGRLHTELVDVFPDREPVEVTRLDLGDGRAFAPDPGWQYNPGQEWQTPFTPPPLDTLPQSFPQGVTLPEILPPVALPASRLLPDDLPPQSYVQAFLREFDADIDHPAVFTDVTGAPLAVSADLFRDGAGQWKSTKNGRGPFMSLLAESIKAPDEVWLRWEESRDNPGSWLLKRRYLQSFMLDDGSGASTQAGLSVFELGTDGWSGSTTMMVKPDRSEAARRRYLEMQRDGFLLYRRRQ